MNTDKTSLENENQPSCLGAVISRLVELAKAEYGEYKEEIIGYELGYCDGIETYWSEEVYPLDELKPDDFYGEPTKNDIENRKLSDEQYFWYGEKNEYCIAKRVKVLNRGWKIQLLHIINGL